MRVDYLLIFYKALARALATRPSVLVVDDIFAALDRKTAAKIFARLFGPNGLLRQSQTTVVMATHSGKDSSIAA